MHDLNQAADVIALMREGEMSDEQIINVCTRVVAYLKPYDDATRLSYVTDKIKTIEAAIAAAGKDTDTSGLKQELRRLIEYQRRHEHEHTNNQ